jgi:hypothetical protein
MTKKSVVKKSLVVEILKVEHVLAIVTALIISIPVGFLYAVVSFPIPISLDKLLLTVGPIFTIIMSVYFIIYLLEISLHKSPSEKE